MVYKLCTQFMAGHCLIFEIIANDSGKFFEVKKKLGTLESLGKKREFSPRESFLNDTVKSNTE